MPALPLDEAGKYVAGAYVVFVTLLLVYIGIMATKLQRIHRELGELTELAEDKSAGASDEVAGRASQLAAPTASQPAGSGREAENSGGGVPEHSDRGVPEDFGGGVRSRGGVHGG
jgi:hypothetical protein